MQDYIFDLRKRPLKEKGRLKLYCNFKAQPIFAIRYSIILVVRADFVIDYAQDNMGIQYELHDLSKNKYFQQQCLEFLAQNILSTVSILEIIQ